MFGLEIPNKVGKQVLFAGPSLLFKILDAISIAASSSRPGCCCEMVTKFSVVLGFFFYSAQLQPQGAAQEAVFGPQRGPL